MGDAVSTLPCLVIFFLRIGVGGDHAASPVLAPLFPHQQAPCGFLPTGAPHPKCGTCSTQSTTDPKKKKKKL